MRGALALDLNTQSRQVFGLLFGDCEDLCGRLGAGLIIRDEVGCERCSESCGSKGGNCNERGKSTTGQKAPPGATTGALPGLGPLLTRAAVHREAGPAQKVGLVCSGGHARRSRRRRKGYATGAALGAMSAAGQPIGRRQRDQ